MLSQRSRCVAMVGGRVLQWRMCPRRARTQEGGREGANSEGRREMDQKTKAANEFIDVWNESAQSSRVPASTIWHPSTVQWFADIVVG